MTADMPISMHGLTPAIIRQARKPAITLASWSMLSLPTESACDPDILCTVLHRTRAVGWPHKASMPEKVEITSAVLHRLARGASGVVCSWPDGTPARTLCTVVRAPGTRPRVVRVRVHTFEDGSYRMTREGGK